jgi:hypothetical protein
VALILLSPAGERDFHVGTNGEAVHIHAQVSRHYDGSRCVSWLKMEERPVSTKREN